MDNKQVCVYGLRGTENIESKVENPHVEILVSLLCIHTVRMTDLQTGLLIGSLSKRRFGATDGHRK